MSDLAKGVIGISIWLVLTAGSYTYAKSCICASLPFCKHNHVVTAVIPQSEPTIERLPIDFEKSAITPLTNEGFEELMNNILSEKTADNLLEITGYYYDEERNTSTFPNLGLARANALKALFSTDISADRIRLKAIKAPIEFNKNSPYLTASDFQWLPADKLSTVEIFSDRTVVRFPFNSVQKELDSDIDQYLDKLSKRIIETKEKVSLTGHTDNIGAEEVNVKLALRRAKMIRDILIAKGVNRRQVNTYSKGESEPISDNDTEEGRKKNRRVVVRLISADK